MTNKNSELQRRIARGEIDNPELTELTEIEESLRVQFYAHEIRTIAQQMGLPPNIIRDATPSLPTPED